MLDGAAHRGRERAPLRVPPGRYQHLGRVGVIDPLDDLLDDRAFVEIVADVVGRGADHLDAAIVGLVVRLGALEPGWKRGVEVDRPAPQSLTRSIWEALD